MNEYKENMPQKIDLEHIMYDVLQGIRRFWWLIIVLAVGFGGKEYFTISKNYRPQYTASSTMAVSCVGSQLEYVNAETAEQMANIFPYILKSGVLQDEIAEDMGMSSMPGSLSMSAEEGTNLFTISATAYEAQVSYDLLQSALRCYPEVAKFVIGEVELQILDETGVPTDSGREEVIRGSAINGALTGAVLGIIIMSFYVMTRKTVRSRKELRNIVNMEDYGSVPYIPQKKRRKKGVNKSVNLKNDRVPQIYLESIRKLRIKVLREMERNGYKSILVTSSIPGEGKTTLAINLAIAIAKQGKNVVLLDCDPRNPSIADTLGQSKEMPGLGPVLKEQVDLQDALIEEKVGGGHLHILCGGKPDTSVAKLLGTDRMKKILEELEKNADIIILDTAPSELLADATALAKYVDAALYVVKYDYAKKTRIRNGVLALNESGIDILGSILNVDKSRRSSGYGYGYKKYGYGYRYGYGYGYGYGKHKGDELSGRVIKE